MYHISQVLWKCELKFAALSCFFMSHDKMLGEWLIYENDWCAKCFCDWPQDKVTLSHLLNRCYGWVVEHEWKWFAQFDEWLYENYWEKIPDWWEY